MGFLNPPAQSPVTFKQNFIKTAVCELRFPTLLELEVRPPHAFQARIRKIYPFYEAQVIEQVGASDPILHEQSYIFRSKDRHWTVTVKSSSIALETAKYESFEHFFERFSQLMDYARDLIDSDFFTRVGLRYINVVPIGLPIEGWIEPALIAPILSGVTGDVRSYASVIHGQLERGGYSFRHGFKSAGDGGSVNDSSSETYNLDFDYFGENVEIQKVPDLVKYFHDMNFSFFYWCLGPKAREALGEGKPK